jgi:alkylation response protein AidB-like acyl-CoA dehydrogenase
LELELSDDQQLFRETTARFLRARWPMTGVRALLADPLGFDRDLWSGGAELGWTSMLVPEEHDGGSISGEGVKDLAIVVEELGAALTPGPTIPTNLVAAAIATGGADHLAKEHLAGIASGQVVATWTSPTNPIAAERADDGLRLTGVAVPVQDAAVADLVLVTARHAGDILLAVLPTSTDGLVVEQLESLDLTRRYARIRFENVQVPDTALLPNADADHLLALALALQCAETVGAAQTVFDFTMQYVQDRKAFGRPIGSFQVLKHRLAEHVLWLETANAVTSAAVAAVQAGDRGLDAARLAKVWVAERCPDLVRDCLQMHGGIGFTWEHDIHLYLRRVDTNTAIHGGIDAHLDALAPTIGFP